MKLRDAVVYAITAYSLAMGALAGLHSVVALLALPLLAPATVERLRRGIGSALFLAGILFLSSGIPGLFPYMVPVLVSAPLVFYPRYLPPLASTVPFGSSSRRALVYGSSLLVAGLVEPRVIISLGVFLASLTMFTLAYFTLLRRVTASVERASSLVTLGSRGELVLSLSTPIRIAFTISASGQEYSGAVGPGTAKARVPLSGSETGLKRIVVDVYVGDAEGFAQRRIARITHAYRVIPATQAAARLHRERRGLMGGGEAGTGLSIELYEARGHGSSRRLYTRSPGGLAGLRAGRGVSAPDQVISEIAALLAGPSVYTPALRRRRIGEYVSSRLYVPGDDPRSIHWKKSLKLQELVVKEYAEETGLAGGGRGGGASRLVVVADLTASNTRELDEAMKKLIEFLAEPAGTAPGADTVLLLHYADRYLVLQGALEEVLEALAQALEQYTPIARYDYESWAEPLPGSVAEAIAGRSIAGPPTVQAMMDYAATVTKLLRSKGVSRGTIIRIIHTVSSSPRNTLLEALLRQELGAQTLRVLAGREGHREKMPRTTLPVMQLG